MSGTATGTGVRLRQAVFAASELEPVAEQLQGALGLREPFRDPGVGMFGLQNVVFALGDCFLEIVSPTEPATAAGRYLERHGGDCGYMVMFDLQDLEPARRRASELGVRVVWQIDLPDISGTHLHPSDMGGAIVSVDSSRPFGSWRWGGPQWTGLLASDGAPGRLVGVTLAVDEPEQVASRWGSVLGVEVQKGAEPQLELDGSRVRFRAARQGGRQGLVEIDVELPHELPGAKDSVEVAGVHVRRLAGGS